MLELRRSSDRLRTAAVHAGEPNTRVCGAISLPLFQSSTYVIEGSEVDNGIKYIRLNNAPNQVAVEKKISRLENAEDTLLTTSGTAAITLTIMSLVSRGDRILVQEGLYAGSIKTLNLLKEQHGIEVDYVPMDQPEIWDDIIKENTKAFLIDSLGNPTLTVAPIDTLIQFCKKHSLPSIVDNTTLSPINFQPCSAGFDYSVNSASKFLGGHSDLVAGTISASKNRIEKIRKIAVSLGVCSDPNTCFLLHRGLKTLPLRISAQNKNALWIAERLNENVHIENLKYPGLANHKNGSIAKKWFRGHGCLITFDIKKKGKHQSIELAAKHFVSNLKFACNVPSFGSVESSVCIPSETAYSNFSKEYRKTIGVPDNMVRLSVGIEHPEDILEDITRALNTL